VVFNDVTYVKTVCWAPPSTPSSTSSSRCDDSQLEYKLSEGLSPPNFFNYLQATFRELAAASRPSFLISTPSFTSRPSFFASRTFESLLPPSEPSNSHLQSLRLLTSMLGKFQSNSTPFFSGYLIRSNHYTVCAMPSSLQYPHHQPQRHLALPGSRFDGHLRTNRETSHLQAKGPCTQSLRTPR